MTAALHPLSVDDFSLRRLVQDASGVTRLIDRTSKGDNMILNRSPMPDRSFPQRQKDILAAFGKFLKQMGTAISSTQRQSN